MRIKAWSLFRLLGCLMFFFVCMVLFFSMFNFCLWLQIAMNGFDNRPFFFFCRIKCLVCELVVYAFRRCLWNVLCATDRGRVWTYRRPGGRARKEQTPARGDGGHAPRHPEHVNTAPHLPANTPARITNPVTSTYFDSTLKSIKWRNDRYSFSYAAKKTTFFSPWAGLVSKLGWPLYDGWPGPWLIRFKNFAT